MKVLFFIQNMGQGGAQRSLITLLTELKLSFNYDVYLAFWNEVPLAYDIPSDLNVIQLGRYSIYNSKIWNYLHSINIVRHTIRDVNPDYVVATMCDMFAKVFWGNISLNKKLIAWEHTSMDRKLHFESEISRKYLYCFADKIILLTNKDKNIYRNKSKNVVVVPNGVPFKEIPVGLSVRNNDIIAVGRLDVWEIKGFDLLMKIWGQINYRHPNWRLLIAGGGNEESIKKVQSIAKENRVSESVVFLGYRKDMDVILQKTKIFVLPSRIEGFPMSLIEAMSQGNSCVAFSIKGAINDIITDGKDGYIVNDGDITTFANKLEQLMDDKKLLDKISHNAIESVQRFSSLNVAKIWSEILK